MAETLDSVIQITLTRESTPVATASFQIPLILAAFTNFSERTRTYTNITGVAEDFNSTDTVYVMAQKLFGQSTVGAVPPSIVVGRRQVDSVTFTPVVADSTVYTVTINGTVYSFTSGVAATATTIVTGLKAAIGTPTGITITGTTTLTVAVTTPGNPWSVTASTNLTAVNATPTETWVDALDAVRQSNDTWYQLNAETHTQADVVALSDAIGATRKIYGTSSQDPNVIAATRTDIAGVLADKSAGRTFGVYLPTANTEFPEAAWAGSQLAYTPGSNDWDFKRASGITVSSLTDTARVNLRSKNMNMYTALGGVNIFQDGNMFDATPIDQVIGEDWLYARLQEQIYFRIINTLKIPMTNAGLVIVENEIRSVLSQAEANGLVARGWTVTTPDVLDIPANLRAARTAGVFQFRARLAGSIRKVIIEGFLSV
jgi:hypothetical protein